MNATLSSCDKDNNLKVKFFCFNRWAILISVHLKKFFFGLWGSSHPGSWKCFYHKCLTSWKYTTFLFLFVENRNNVQKSFKRGAKVYCKMRQLRRPFSKVTKTLFKIGEKVDYFRVTHNNVSWKGFSTNKNNLRCRDENHINLIENHYVIADN